MNESGYSVGEPEYQLAFEGEEKTGQNLSKNLADFMQNCLNKRTEKEHLKKQLD